MSDKPEEQPKVEPVENPQDPKTETPTLEDVLAQNKLLMESLETQKKEIKGINQSNTDKETRYQELLKSTETEKQTKERLDKDKFAQDEADKQARLTEISDTKTELNQLKIVKEAFKYGYTEEDLEFLKFTTPEDVKKHHEWTEARDLKIKEGTAKNILDSHSGKPEGYINDGSNPNGVFPGAIERALKR